MSETTSGHGPLLAAFVTGYEFELDDYQLAACRLVEDGAGVLVAAPTGAGKTVVGEFAVWCALQLGRKCFYTTPIKALSNQKFHDLVERHGPDRVGLLTGDTSINGDAQVVVMTTEVLRNMIHAESTTLGNLGYVVMDEVHYLADRFRGAVWEEVILGLAPEVQVISLSATVSNAEEFGDWLAEVRGRVEVVLSERRPVPLYQHVMAGRRLLDLFDGQAPTEMALPATRAPDVNPELLTLSKQETRAVRDDARRPRGRSGRGRREVHHGSGRFGGAHHDRGRDGGRGRDERDRRPSLTPRRDATVEVLRSHDLLPAIVFIFSRQGCDGAVRQLLGSGIRLTNAAEARELREIVDRHTGGLDDAERRALDHDTFVEALTRGIAAHHAGILPAYKAVVEEGFEAGLIKVVYATETLALGINMPARTVVIEKLVKYNGETHADITPGEYTQLTGRAGRRGIDVEGHAVVLWQAGIDPRALAGLASRRTYPLRSSFAPTYNMAVNLVARLGRAQARSLLEQSFAQFQTDRTVVGMAREANRDEEAIAGYLESASCHLGDFAEYARLREQLSRLEAEAARGRKADHRAESLSALLALEPGDIIWVPHGRHGGWAAVVDPGRGRDAEPHPLVMTEKRDLVRLTLKDFPTPTASVGRIRIPRRFDPKSAPARKSLAASLLDRLSLLQPEPPARSRPDRDEEVAREVDRLRRALRQHPCHACPDRESHARFAERAMRLERKHTELSERMARRTNTIAVRFDRICQVLVSLGYLDAEDPDVVTTEGLRLQRIYSELDLVAAESLRDGAFDDLDVPQLAAVLSTFVYEARRVDHARIARMPDRTSEQAGQLVRQTWRRVSLVERDFKLDRAPEPDIGFAEAAHAWAGGAGLDVVLYTSGLPAGDFVRWVRQVVDFAGQVADAAGPGDLRRRCRDVISAMRRGVVEFDPDED
ncbi:DEAD/DEAH box helicase [Aestuariimicrobium ganziense]|uniref:DEAD/DEAH box helicase n=1 Tax=Aestuariimicrobium ganziense TaxID=2773677 RepID=UPI002E292778|nr:DEAD/DEAH box helicase [Aestuariimicrobium ganziense]